MKDPQDIQEAKVICLRSYKAARICYEHLMNVNPHYRYNFYAIYLSCLQKNQDSNFEYTSSLERILEEVKASQSQEL